ncbi:BnaC07g18600D [Brassica napus]|uniref:BnaC07g18600D protein n=1 Tax=Brassica napus TaxID=3708 RepID=A0A078HKC5_BRANA|nr:BnaC07g18600D [Brassica napus]
MGFRCSGRVIGSATAHTPQLVAF